MRTRPIAFAVVGALLGATGSLDARAATADEVKAEALFRDGMQKFDAGNTAAACASFTESLRLDPKIGTLLNLALCHEKQGKIATAWLEYNTGAAWATQNGQKERREFANGRALNLEGQLSRVLLQLPPAGELSSVELDGEPLPEPRWYLPLYLDPGAHSIAVSAPGKTRRAVRVIVPREPSAQLIPIPMLQDVPKVEAPPAKPPPPPPPPEPPSSSQKTIGFVLAGGAGVVGLAVGSVFGVMAVQSRDNAASHCVGNVCDGQGAQYHNDAQTNALVSTIAFGAGALAVAVGAVLVLTSPKAGSVQASISPRGAVVGGTF